MDTVNKLDEKLRELKVIKAYDSVLQSEFNDGLSELDIDGFVDEIKQAFIDAGWINIPNLKPGDLITVNDGTAVFNGDGTVTPIVRMTGQEWYDKFEKELPRLGEIVTKEYNDGYADAVIAALTAAKKAAGIE